MNKYKMTIYGVQNNNHKHVAGINNKENNKVILENNFTHNNIFNKIIRLCWLSKLDFLFNLFPVRKLLYNIMFQVDDTKQRNIYLFCNGKYISQDKSLFFWIKNRDPKSIILIWLLNPLSKSNNALKKLSRYQSLSDFVSIYDKEEAQIFKINHLPLTYGRLLPLMESKCFKYDLVFLGKAKDRLDLIMETYFYFKKKGLKVKYLLVGVKKGKRIKFDDISYISGISYLEYLKYINSSKIILEIIQKGTVSFTSRALEASFYKRKLITNAKNIFNEDFINKDETLVFDKVSEINDDFFESEINYESFINIEESKFNSINLLNNIISFL